MKNSKQHQEGFVLLYAVIVSMVVLTVGVSLMNIITKQLIISSVGRSAKVAYYSALNGKECFDIWEGVSTGSGSNIFADPSVTGDANIYCEGKKITLTQDTNGSDYNQAISTGGSTLPEDGGLYYQEGDLKSTLFKLNNNTDKTCVFVNVVYNPNWEPNLQIGSFGYNVACDSINSTNPRKVRSEITIP